MIPIFLNRWHPEVALRYLPVVDEIRKLGGEPKVLDVGSGGLGIAPYLEKPVTGVDLSFQPPYHQLLTRVKGSALALPFPPRSFDVVIAVDMMEHLSKKDRARAIAEFVRVAKKKVIIAVPVGKESQKQDEALDRLYEKRHGSRFRFLEEQTGFGLPEKEDIMEALTKSLSSQKRGYTVTVAGNENLSLRLFLMKGFISTSFITNVIHRKLLLFLVPLMRHWNSEPCYRQIFTVTYHEHSN